MPDRYAMTRRPYGDADRHMMYDDIIHRFGGVDVCPFCANPNVHLYMGHRFHVECGRCQAEGPVGMDPPEAIIKWNERLA